MEEEYDPLSHLSTALSLLPRTLTDIGFSLPVALSEVDQMDAFFDHMYIVLQKDPKSGNKSLEKCPGPNPNTTEKEGDKAGKKCSVGAKSGLQFSILATHGMELQFEWDMATATVRQPYGSLFISLLSGCERTCSVSRLEALRSRNWEFCASSF